jgi:hypothetical protein
MRFIAILSVLVSLALPATAQDPDLVFITVNPCVIFDTRPVFGGTGAFAAEEQRSLNITGSTADFEAQGGTPGGCGVPAWSGGQPVARAIFINYIAIDPQGGGQMKAWAGDKTEPAQGALVNYQALTPPMNNSNAVVTELRQDSEGLDIKVRARSAGTHIRGVIIGYFTKDHITGVNAGTGLTGGGPSGTVTLSIADGGVGTAQLAMGAVTSDAIGDGAVSAAKIQSGASIPERRGFTVTTIGPGKDNAIIVGSDGLPLIVFHEPVTNTLRVAHCSDVACTGQTVSTIDTVGGNPDPSITIGQDGFGLMSYYSAVESDLYVAHCEDVTCSTATVIPLRTLGDVGRYSSIAVGSDGLGLISYFDALGSELHVVHCANIACTSADSGERLDTAGGGHTSLTIGADGLGLISYEAFASMRVAHCSNVLCSAATVTAHVQSGASATGTSVTIVDNSFGLIVFTDNDGRLWTAPCASFTCTSVLSQFVIDNSETVLLQVPSVTTGLDGYGLISYSAASKLNVAHCTNVPCSSATIRPVDTATPSSTSITIGSDGFPIVTYDDTTSGNLKVAHFSNIHGIPYVRRR